MKKSILFVDDESNVLNGLRRMLYDRMGEWDMVFADSGIKALEIMSGRRFDILVTDMRMPGMDGVSLLEKVHASYPDTIRIVLSGQTERAEAMRAVKLAHQFLFKPCSAPDLKAILDKALKLQKIHVNDDVRLTISKLEVLPSFPPLYHELLHEIDKENSSIQRIADVISKDVGMTASILKLVNSSFFGLSVHVSTPSHAVTILGTEVIRGLVLTVHLFEEFKFCKELVRSFNMLWKHSLNTAYFAKTIGGLESDDIKFQDNCFLAGILHDVGKLVLASNFEEDYVSLLKQVRAENRTIGEVEFEHYNFNHAEVGAYLLGLWGLADEIVEAVACHHNPRRCPTEQFTVLHAVHAANAIEHELNVINRSYAPHPVDDRYLTDTGFLASYTRWRELCADVNRTLANGV